ncbi:N-formylglutamate amidohydrolase [uncultured Pseudodesulfovibrio sp.]|uniref:N-formylglutamate amidohydrolase n=1 Tax=uncultured Pseudodesulfovibrio sp. TaxID=2035858 RepID=UPI0029C6913C|nr:N-formylglutamate amidohydrolase [uncultured Pseudodesulfovibrio sp.]
MTDKGKTSLLGPEEPAAVEVVNPKGRSRFVLTCEHAGRSVPASLNGLGIDPGELARHIAWDIGAAATARRLSEQLDAPLVMQRYSRLVLDCNRPLDVPSLIPEVSDGTVIPANADLSAEEREARVNALFRPYHGAIEHILDERDGEQPCSLLFSVHSFTPKLSVNPDARPMHLGLLFMSDPLALAMKAVLDGMDHPYTVTLNAPYRAGLGSDYTVPVHGEERGLPNMLLEIRNDQIDTPKKARAMGDFLAQVLRKVDAEFGHTLTMAH